MSEPAAGPSGPGTVIMELGASIGALILYTPAQMDGKEIEISCDDEPGDLGSRRTHSQIRPRHMPGETRYAAVYPGLPGRALHDLARRAQPGGRRHRHRRAGQQLPLARLSRRVLRALASAWGRPAPLTA